MSLTATYGGDLSRVQLSASSLGGGATWARVERSADEVTWHTVRGGVRLPVASGEADLDDYEFYPGNTYYRVTSYDDSGAQQAQHATSIVVDLDTVWLKSVRFPALNRPVTVENWSDISRGSRDTPLTIVGRSLPVAASDLRTSRQFSLDIRTDLDTDGTAQAAELDLILATGGVWLVHVPQGWPVPGGHVVIGDTTWDRVVRHGQVPHRISIPCTNVAPPRPTVTGTLLTGATILRLYGSGQALISAHPTGRSLLATMLDPDDLVVVD